MGLLPCRGFTRRSCILATTEVIYNVHCNVHRFTYRHLYQTKFILRCEFSPLILKSVFVMNENTFMPIYYFEYLRRLNSKIICSFCLHKKCLFLLFKGVWSMHCGTIPGITLWSLNFPSIRLKLWNMYRFIKEMLWDMLLPTWEI